MQNKRQIIKKIRAHVEKAMLGEGSGHDWWHVARVAATAKRLAAEEPKADAGLVELGALLHDIKDWKFAGGDEEAGPKEARRLLKKAGASEELAAQVAQIVREVSYKGAKVKTVPTSLSSSLVQDADRLDAIGAIGIARCFAYGGAMHRAIYDPREKPVLHASFAQYKKAKGHSINHFYEKLLLLKKRMNTKAGKREAQKRHAFMELYLKNFYREWG